MKYTFRYTTESVRRNTPMSQCEMIYFNAKKKKKVSLQKKKN